MCPPGLRGGHADVALGPPALVSSSPLPLCSRPFPSTLPLSFLCAHFALGRFPGKVATRHLDTCDIIYDASAGEHVERLFQEPLRHSGHQAVGYHGFLDLSKRLQMRRWMLATGSPSFALTLKQGQLRIHPWTPEA